MRRISLLVLTLAFSLPSFAMASTTEVGVKDFAFDKKTVTIAVGDSVHWSREAGSVAPHTITANSGFFNKMFAGGGSIDFTVTFAAGTFRYYCQYHGAAKGGGAYGMIGFVKVPDRVTAAPKGTPFTVRWATSSATTGSSYDVAYRIGSGSWKPWLTKTTLLKAVFGKNGKPARPKSGTAYSFRSRARTSKGASLWSPVATFTP
jgi:plastocyanin